MIKSYLPFNDFFSSSVCLAFFYAYGVVTPLSLLLNCPAQIIFLLFAIAMILTVWGMYHVAFVSPVNISFAAKLSIFSLPVVCLPTFPEVLGKLIDSPKLFSNESLYFNASYALVIAVLSYVWAFIDTNHQFNKNAAPNRNRIELWTVNIYLSDHSFEDLEQQRNLKALVSSWLLVGIVMVCTLVLPTISSEVDDLKLLIAKIGAMIPTAALIGINFLYLGQATRIVQFERKIGIPLSFRNYPMRMKWRHDYVKYHLPAPIRKLNLRLFNQHVEAYERLQQEVKT